MQKPQIICYNNNEDITFSKQLLLLYKFLAKFVPLWEIYES